MSITPLGFSQVETINLEQEYLNPTMIFEIIDRSNELNPQIKNADLIFPEWILSYKIYKNLPPVSFVVKRGDSQYKILSRYIMLKSDIIINDLVEKNWKVARVEHFSNLQEKETQTQTQTQTQNVTVKYLGFTLSLLELEVLKGIFLLIVILAIILGYMFFNKKIYLGKDRERI